MKRLGESSYSRLWAHTKDGSTFAIIGSEDKDTKESRYDELKELIKGVMVYNSKVGYNKVDGTYTYKLTGETTFERGLVIYNISKEDALRVAGKINQESIIWKDKQFFGILGLDGDVIEQFNNHERNLNFSKAKEYGFGTKLQKDDNIRRPLGFAFEEVSMKNSSVNILKTIKESLPEGEFNKRRDFLYSMYDKIKAGWDSVDWHSPMSFELDMDINSVALIIRVEGDWKHEHAAIDQIAKETTNPDAMKEEVVEGGDSDWYVADHYYLYGAAYRSGKYMKESEDYPALEKEMMEKIKEFLLSNEGVTGISIYQDLELNWVCKYQYNGETFIVSVDMMN